MKKRLLYIVALILTGIANSAFIYGQSSVLEKLQEKTWRWQRNDGRYTDYKYTCCQQIGTRENGRSVSNTFYLSDTPDTQFNDDKVGNVSNGRYMIRPGFTNDPEFPVFVEEIVELNDAEFKIRLRTGSVATFKALEYYTMKHAINNTPVSTLPFTIRKATGFLEGYDFPVASRSIPDMIYTTIQRTDATNNSSAMRGKFLRKFKVGSYFLVIVTFGDPDDLRTDVLCSVDANGNILSTLEIGVTGDGMMVKDCTITPSGDVYVYQAVSNGVTPTRFEDVLGGFRGPVEDSLYNLTNGRLVKNTAYSFHQSQQSPVIRVFSREKMSDPNVSVSYSY